MSNILKKIETLATGKNFYEPGMVSVQVEHSPYNAGTVFQEYRISVRLGAVVKVANIEQLSEAKRAIANNLKEIIFGEFRGDLAKAQYLMYDRNFDEAMKILKDIETRMYD